MPARFENAYRDCLIVLPYHSVHWGINPSHPSKALPSPLLILQTVPAPILGNPAYMVIYWFL